ncbi:MAG: hypothetical protein QM755_01395 [Luteolibacter sp.]
MRSPLPLPAARPRGITLIELTVVLCVLLTLVGITYVASTVWRKGAGRAECIMTLYHVQLAVRSYQNLSGAQPGNHPEVAEGSYDIGLHLLKRGFIGNDLYDSIQGLKPCQGGGTYACDDVNTFPQVGQLYMECSLAGEGKHVPNAYDGW